jgi:hypothetical protein
MNWTTILQVAWDVVNSPAGITVMAGGLLWLLNRLYAAKPAWQDFEGTIIAAVKWAEKEIPDDASNKAVKRLDAALAYVLKVYEDARGTADARTRQEMREGIQIVHAELEASGTLAAKANPEAAG